MKTLFVQKREGMIILAGTWNSFQRDVLTAFFSKDIIEENKISQLLADLIEGLALSERGSKSYDDVMNMINHTEYILKSCIAGTISILTPSRAQDFLNQLEVVMNVHVVY